ncbi:PREDICTED: UDP-glycosyltransferase 74F2 [Theobroma cacao]|uniref:Glycosyltransferase n=1 Tax=Theobroma cacao TaxID=3641 RepID=A0AB32V8D4_THECC|nr:PREDICTED: UDP-glycosyltransferase 74F2 [Theobroma cacao]
MEKKAYRAHVLALPYPSQGHVNPMLQFSKRLASKGIKATFATTLFISHTMKPESLGSVEFDTISDGCDQGGFSEAESIHDYLKRLEAAGSKTLADLIIKYKNSPHPFDCVIYDSFLPWALDVAKQFGLVGAAFFTQACAVNYIYYYAHHGLLSLPVSSEPVSIPGLPLLQLRDMPSFIYVAGSYPFYFELVLSQFSNSDKADFVLVNTFYKLEHEAVESMSKVSPLLTIGPTIPSMYLDQRVETDEDYDLNLFKLDSSSSTEWLSTKPPGSVVFVSFGSMANLSVKQMEELAWGIKQSNFYFLWVVRSSEEAKIPNKFVQEMGDKGVIANWIPQMQVLANESVGCFFTHCGWNSTIEALCLGVPVVAMPQWTDQTTDAKFVEDVWKVGVRVEVDENGIVNRDEIEYCIRQVMEGETGKVMKENAKKWKQLAIEAVSEGGSSDKNINEFVSKLTRT